jgi:hypothetical protein
MIGLVKTLIDKLLPDDAVTKVFAYVRDQRKASIGADIFCVYHSLNKVYLTADGILTIVEQTIATYDEAQGRAAALRPYYMNLNDLIGQQIRELQTLRRHFDAVDRQVHLLSGDSFVVISRFYDGKQALYRKLSDIIAASKKFGNGVYGIAVLLANEDAVIKAIQAPGRADQLPAGADLLYGRIGSEIQSFHDRLEGRSVTSLYPELVAMLREYMLDGARENLRPVRSALDQLYAQIRTTFTVDDLLPKVGDHRMRDLEWG